MLRARTLEELLDAAALLSSQPLPRGRRVGVITNAGGLGILCADACESAGLTLPELCDGTRSALARHLPAEASLANPVDLLGSATAETYEAVIAPVLADDNLDALIIIFVPPVVAGADEVAAAVRRAVEHAATTMPVVAVIVSAEGTPAVLRAHDSPVVALPYPESAARALSLAAAHADWLARPAASEAAITGIDMAAARTILDAALTETPDGWLTPAAARALLEAYGIPVVPELTVASAEEAVAAACALGFPAVVKTAAPGVHKTELGGVAVALGDAEAVRAAADRIGCPVIVQPFLHGRTELLAGIVQDPVFGPLVAFGPGGVLAELIGEASFRLAPLDSLEAKELVTGGKAGRLVAGFRGAPAADTAALVNLVLRLARLAADMPNLRELDLNPILAGPDGCVSVDARVRATRTAPEQRLKSW